MALEGVQITAGSGTKIAADQQPSGEWVQYIKIVDGTLDSVNPWTIDSAGDGQVKVNKLPHGNLANGAIVNTAGSAARQLVAANANRKRIVVENRSATETGYVGTTGVAVTTGDKLGPGDRWDEGGQGCPVNAIFAIRSGSTDIDFFVQETA